MPPAPSHARRRPDFHDLMQFRIWDVLLVARPYDSFILEEAGQLAERMLGEFRNLDVHYAPGLTNVATGAEAIALARRQSRFNLVISALQLQDMNGAELARRIRAEGLDVPVVLLAFDNRELKDFVARADTSGVERLFLWHGDARILLAIVKCIEDRRNAAHDTESVGVQVILLVEDNVRFYSAYLPEIYSELLRHSQRVVAEGMNLSEKITRMRARPKILLCRTFEEARQVFETYRDDVLGVIADVEFPRAGHPSRQAGFDFARLVRAPHPDVPVLLQSARPENEARARALGTDFLLKDSPRLLQEVKPNYTADAMRAKIQGVVTLEAVVNPDGSVGNVSIVRSLDPTFGLDQEAIKTVRKWRFAPGTRFGQPVPVLVEIEMTFTLR